jgi:hypothetical protein
MTKSDFFILALKVIGLYFFVLVFNSTIQFVLVVINSFFNDFGGEFLLMYSGMTISIVIYGLLGYLLIFKTAKFLRILRILPENKEFKVNVDKIDLIELSLVVISVIAIVFSIPGILASLTDIIYFPVKDEFGYSEKSFDVNSYERVFQLVIGIFLLLNARNFSKWINRHGIKDDEFDIKNMS